LLTAQAINERVMSESRSHEFFCHPYILTSQICPKVLLLFFPLSVYEVAELRTHIFMWCNTVYSTVHDIFLNFNHINPIKLIIRYISRKKSKLYLNIIILFLFYIKNLTVHTHIIYILYNNQPYVY
jgi:hypothetical protein